MDPTCLLNLDFAVFLKVPVDHPYRFIVVWKIFKKNANQDRTVLLQDGGLHALMTAHGKCHRFFTDAAPIAPPQPTESRAR